MNPVTLTKKVIAVVPAYNPTEALAGYCAELLAAGIYRVVVVNDGSRSECRAVFAKLSLNHNVDVLTHEINMGKGCALKTAFTYLISSKLIRDIDGVVTADADGQHLCADVIRIANELSADSRTIILGVRDFDAAGVPLKNRLGNKISAFVYRLLYCQKVDDTQTGLRALPSCLLPWACGVGGERFEYEMKKLTALAQAGITAKCVPISVIYDPENYSTHFNPIKDSYKIMKILFCEVSARPALSLLAYLTEIALLAVFMKLMSFKFPASVVPALSTVFAVSLRYLLIEMLSKSADAEYFRRLTPYVDELLTAMFTLLVVELILPKAPEVTLILCLYAPLRILASLLYRFLRLKKANS